MNIDNSELIGMLLDCEAVQFGDFTLTSGKKSSYYCDIKKAMTIPRILKEIARLATPFINARDVTEGLADRIAGMELGAVPIATAVSLASGKPFLIIRKKGRSHGTGKRIEGVYRSGEKVLIVEDVATTGGSMVKTAEVLEDAGLVVAGALVVVDREEGAAALLEERNIRFDALVKISEILERT